MTNTIARVRRAVLGVRFAGALVLLAGCASVTPIGELLDNSSKYNGKTVQIQGTVKESAGVLGRGGYQVSDKTGTLTVISEVSEPPRTGAEVSVKGVFESLFTLGSKSLAVLREQSHEYK
ncbi:MAG TPA: hypothetical protein VN719_10045 [Gemmatimonadales bacterium]|jgi:hypothetical protein|nr:hypothetical protein [Gemmatimonadales bacterium]